MPSSKRQAPKRPLPLGLWPQVLTSLVAVVLVVGSLYERHVARQASERTTPQEPISAPLPPPPAKLTQEEREVADLHGLLAALGFPRSEDPWMVLEMIFYGQDKELAERARMLLDRLRPSPSTRYFGVRFHEHRGEFVEVLELTRHLEYDEPVASYWDGKLKLKGLESRILLEGPRVDSRPPEAVLGALRGDIAAFERRLRGGDSVPLRVLRVELWDRLARRLEGRPRVIYPALEFAEALLFEVIEELPQQRGYLRAMMHLLANRFAGHMGDLPRVDALTERFEGMALEPVAAIPEVRRYWTFRFREDGRKLREPVPVVYMSRPPRSEAPPGWLPWPAALAGTWDRPGEPAPALVLDPVPRPPVRLESLGGGDASGDFFRREAQARVAGLPLEADPQWIQEHLAAAKVEAASPVARAALAWPSLALALEPGYSKVARRDRLRELLDETEARSRAGPADVPTRRLWYRGSWQRLTLTRMQLALEAGDVDAARRIARGYLSGAASLLGPWTRSEVVGVRAVRGMLDSVLNDDGACAESIAELRRLSFLLAAGPSAPGFDDIPVSILHLPDYLAWIRAASSSGAAPSDLMPLLEGLTRSAEEFDRSRPGELPRHVLLELRDLAMFLRYPTPRPARPGGDACRTRGLAELPRPFAAVSPGLEAERAELLERLGQTGP